MAAVPLPKTGTVLTLLRILFPSAVALSQERIFVCLVFCRSCNVASDVRDKEINFPTLHGYQWLSLFPGLGDVYRGTISGETMVGMYKCVTSDAKLWWRTGREEERAPQNFGLSLEIRNSRDFRNLSDFSFVVFGRIFQHRRYVLLNFIFKQWHRDWR